MKNAIISFFNKDYSSLKPYLIGFVFSVFLTLIPFIIVIINFKNKVVSIGILVSCAFIQILIHLIYFLQLNFSSNQKWIITSFIFTLSIIVIIITGSLWIMWNLNHNLMQH